MDKEQLPNEYEDLYRTVLEFMGGKQRMMRNWSSWRIS